jgi:phosphogluconate dehydratase
MVKVKKMTHPTITEITNRIAKRSQDSRARYMARIEAMRAAGRPRPNLACGNLAHAIAACPEAEKHKLTADGKVPGIGIVSAYNDMLSAHQPYHKMLDAIKNHVLTAGGVAQMAGGVPAMCDGVTQGQPGMEMSLFSRDVIALSTALALTHKVFDGAMLLGVCDKIVPGLLMGALSFGHLPMVFVPAGPMPTGISNSEKAKVRQQYAAGEMGRDELLKSESRAYHSPGTCTFYGTANSNQTMLEFMGLQLPGSSFVQPNTELRAGLNRMAAELIVHNATAEKVTGLADIVDARAIVNGIIGLLTTGGSTNHTLHIVAIAAAAGYRVTWQDFSDLSDIVPLLARVYPNGLADVNAFHEAGGTSYVMKELLGAGLMHHDARTILGGTMTDFGIEPFLKGDEVKYQPARDFAGDDSILREVNDPFQSSGGLKVLHGNIGEAVIKISAVKADKHVTEAPAVCFDHQDDLIKAYKAGELEKDFVAVIRYQGPKAIGMPELHKLTPTLGLLQDKGYRVALVTDGRMSGASGKVPAAIHVSPEAADGGLIARVRDGDVVRLDATKGTLEVLADLSARDPAPQPETPLTYGRNIFTPFRQLVGPADEGGSIFGAIHR